MEELRLDDALCRATCTSRHADQLQPARLPLCGVQQERSVIEGGEGFRGPNLGEEKTRFET